MSEDSPLLKEILEQVQEIPPLPEVALKVMRMTRDPNVSAGALNKVICQDQALTTNLLKLCNSAYYGLPRVISSVTQAIMYLGFQTVRNMVLSSTVSDLYSSYTFHSYPYDEGNGLWRHSFGCAMGSQLLCKRFRPGLADTAFTAGLLHDVGKLLMDRAIADQADEMSAEIEAGSSIWQAEMNVFGFSHAEVGSRVADTWNFPQELAQAIGYHHAPGQAPGRPLLTCLVHLANAACNTAGIGMPRAVKTVDIDPYALEATGYTREDVDSLAGEIVESLEASEREAPQVDTEI